LVASGVLIDRSFELANQAKELLEKNLELQNLLSNFTSMIVASPEQSRLDEGGYYSNGSINPVVTRGWLNISLMAITPHYGNVSVEVENFIVNDYDNKLDPEKINLTTVSYTHEYQYSQQVSNVASGLNQLNLNLNLEATVYPNPQELPTMPQFRTSFAIGVLFLKAKLFDAQTNQTITKEFSTVVFVTINGTL
jgi:hypothetical protein